MNELKTVINLFSMLMETNSTNEKKDIIRKNADNYLFKKYLLFLLDNINIQTGISEKKLHKEIKKNIQIYEELNTFDEVLDYIKENNTGTDSIILSVQKFLETVEDDLWFYEGMITKKIKLGCDAKLVNDSIPRLIPIHNVMLGTSIEHCNLKGTEWISISRKLNGIRMSKLENKCVSRQGKQFFGVDHILNDLHKLGLDEMFVDGEFIYKNKEKLTDSEAFQKGTGIANSKTGDKTQLKLVIFDYFPLEEFYNGKSKEKYSVRKKNIEKLKDRIEELKLENVEVVQFCYEGYDHEEIWKWLDYAENNDWEGVMINLDSIYECKRTKTLIKVKQFYDIDLEIVGFNEGTSKNKGKFGSFIVDYKGNKVDVRGRISDDLSDKIWNNKDEYLGRVIMIRYKEITKDKKTGLESLQFPTFIMFREKGKEVSYE